MNDRLSQKNELPHIMVVDDVPANLKLLTEILAGCGFEVRLATSGDMALKSIAVEAPDLILLDVKMPEMDGYEVCQRLKSNERLRTIPVIFISALEETEDKVKGFEAGGVDYITKPFQPAEVLKRIETHLAMQRMQARLEEQNQRLQREIAGHRRTEEELRKHKVHLEELVAERTADLQQEIQEHTRMEEELKENALRIREANERFETILRAATAYSIVGTDTKGIIKIFNVGAELMLGYQADEIIDKAWVGLFHDPGEIEARAAELGIAPGLDVFVSAALRGATETRQWTYVRKDGSRIAVSLTVSAMRSETGELTGFIGIARDITAEKKLEQQLVHSQKMESVGLLAGGIAHDFNNLLTPILGYAEMLMAGFPENDPRFRQLGQIKQAAERARDMTKRLLAFSRKQIIELKVVELGDIIHQFEHMLRRTIRENITIEVATSSASGKVWADAGQIELLLLNLSINAQDAMPEGGLLTIETKNVDLDASYAASHPEIKPGPFVMLAVSDTGIGIDDMHLDKIFDPFFTTKGVSKGTGLGLSTAYGIVKQHGGSIFVYSEKNKGSVFKILLPRIIEEGASLPVCQPPADVLRHGSETVLIAEDNDMVRSLAHEMLNSLGYRVLEAETPEICVELLKKHRGTVDLLLTDVIMPGMNGKELFDALKGIQPDLKVLFMSGYTRNVMAHHRVLGAGIIYIQKPFSMALLSEKIREALDN